MAERPPMADIRSTLDERGKTYGRFDGHAAITEAIIAVLLGPELWGNQAVVLRHTNWLRLEADQRQALRVIADKIARILHGDPNHVDSWHDIAGYATLIVDRLNGTGAYAATVTGTDCFEAGGIISKEQYDDGRCRYCYAQMGDVHAPGCPRSQATRNPR